MIMSMKTNTAMKLATVPSARQIHPLGHVPSPGPQLCQPRPPRSSADLRICGGSATAVPDNATDSLVLGVRVRNAPLYRRRRSVAAVLGTALLLGIWSLLSVFAHHLVPAAVADPVPGSAAAVHVVQPGDTLWSIASDVVEAPGDQVRQVVDQLAASNGGAALKVGQHLRLGDLDFG
jgi:hypothetical protein